MQPLIKAEARLVLVDAIVTDNKGNYISDLTQKDFRVWEDDIEQPIKTFSFESSTSPAANQPSYLVLFFDNSNMKGADQIKARQVSAKFIEASTGQNRYIALLDFGGMITVAQNFTADAERLMQVVRNENNASVSAAPEPVQMASSEAPLMISAQANFGARTLLLGIRSVAKNLASVPGRKSLILFTSGFPMTPQLNSELIAAIDACNKANVAIYPIDVRGLTTDVSGGGMGSLELSNGIGSAGRVMVSAQYTPAQVSSLPARLVYVSDEQIENPGGTKADSQPPNARRDRRGSGTGGWTGGASTTYGPTSTVYQTHQIVPLIPRGATSSQQVLYSLATGTGGFVILNSNDLLGALQKIPKEQNEYYVLGYTPVPSQEGSCHILRVKVQRSGATVRSRSGYCNVKPADLLAGKPIEKQLETYAADASLGTITASLRASYFHASPKLARVELAIEVPPGAVDITKQKGRFRGTLDVLGLAYKPDGTVGARFSDSVPLEFANKKEVEEFGKKPLNYNHQFEAVPGHYDLKVVFTSGGEHFAKLEAPLLIEPYNGKQISMSAVALSKEFYPVSRTADTLDAALLENRVPLVSRGVEFFPSGSSQFRKGEPAAFYVEVYDPLLLGPNPPQVDIEVKVSDRKTGAAKVAVSGPVPQVSAGNPMVPVGLKIPLETLAPGAYRLELKATDSTGSTTPARSVDFEVE